MKTEYKYIRFERAKRMSEVWKCVSKKNEDLGLVQVFPRWHCWVFQPNDQCDFSAGCLADVIDFIKQLKK